MSIDFTPQQAKEEIARLKKSNKVYREKVAVKKGFKTYELYLAELLQVSNGESGTYTNKKVADNTPVIYVVDVLDRSGSMGSYNTYLHSYTSKIRAAVDSINAGVIKLQQEESSLGVKYKYMLTYFDTEIVLSKVYNNIKEAPTKNEITGRGGTALNDAIMMTLLAIDEVKRPEDKVLVNIYTDGGENASRKYHARQVKEKIDILSEQGYTITFIGTDQDVDYMVRNLNVTRSNTMSYDGTSQGLSRSMSINSAARTEYSSKVAKGEDVTKDFYKKFKK